MKRRRRRGRDISASSFTFDFFSSSDMSDVLVLPAIIPTVISTNSGLCRRIIAFFTVFGYCLKSKNACVILMTGIYCNSWKHRDKLHDIQSPSCRFILSKSYDQALIASLKKDGVLDTKNVVIFTASSDPKITEEMKNIGVKEILKKPISIDELTSFIDSYNPDT